MANVQLASGFTGTLTNGTVFSMYHDTVDNKIYLVGAFSSYKGTTVKDNICRVNMNGTLDTTFSGFTTGFNDYVYKIKRNDNKLYVGGTFTRYNGSTANRLISLNLNGSINSTFDTGTGFDSNVSTPSSDHICHDIDFDSSGNTYWSGVINNYKSVAITGGIIRIKTDGSRDTNFAVSPGGNDVARVCHVNSSNKVYVGGNFTLYNGQTIRFINRLNSNGTKDSSFTSPFTNGSYGSIRSIFEDSNGYVYATGRGYPYTEGIYKLNNDGSFYSGFTGHGLQLTGCTGNISLGACVPGEKVILKGSRVFVFGGFNYYNSGNTANNIIVLRQNGSINTTFNFGNGFPPVDLGGQNYKIFDAFFDSNSDLFVAGSFQTYNSTGTTNFTKLLTSSYFEYPEVSTNGITSITNTDAVGGGNVLDEGTTTVTARGICWNTSGSPTTGDTYTSNGTGGGSFTANLTGLGGATNYYVRAYAKNNSGIVYGEEVVFKTKLNPPTLTGNIVNGCTNLSWTDTNAEKEKYQIWREAGNGYPLTDLFAYWKLDEVSRPFKDSTHGNRFPDYYGNGAYPSNGYTDADGILNGCFFNNQRNYKQAIPLGFYSNNVINGGYFNSYSFNAWIKRDSTGIDAIASCMRGQSANNPYNGWAFFIDATNHLRLQIINTETVYTDYSAIDIQSQQTITDDNWHMVTFTYGGRGATYSTDARPQLFIDGSGCTLNYLNYSFWSNEWSSGSYMSIGAMTANNLLSGSDNGSHYEFRGRIDEVGIWSPEPYNGYPEDRCQDKNLSAANILKLWNSGQALRYQPCSTGQKSLLTTISYPTQTYNDCSIITGCTYTYCVKALLDSYNPDLISTCSNDLQKEIGGVLIPSGLTITNIVATGSTLTWVNNSGNLATGNRVELSLDGGQTWNMYSNVSSGATTSNITGLTPNTYYCLRVVAYNAFMEIASDDSCFTTANPKAVNLTATYITHTATASTTWQLPYLYATGLTMQLRTSGMTTWWNIANIGSHLTGYTFTNLAFGTSYEYRVVSNGPSGSFYSDIHSFATPALYLPTITTKALSGSTFTTATSGGIPTSDGGSDIIVRGIVWSTSANPTVDNYQGYAIATPVTGMTSFTLDLTNLIPNAQYHVRAYAQNIVGVGYGQDLYFETKGSYQDTYLRFNDDILYDLEVKNFEVNYALTDIKSLALAKSSFTLPIMIPFTPNSARIFGTLFNVNNMSQAPDLKIPTKLIYKDKIIINGYSYIDHVTFDYIYLTISRADLNIFELTTDLKLSDLTFTGATYDYTNKLKDTRLTDMETYQYSGTTEDLRFILMDWYGVAGNEEFKRNFTNISELVTNYNLTPVVNVKTIFDKIFAEQGYTYSASTKFIDKIEKLYMTTDVPASNYTDNVESFYHLTQTNGAAVPLSTYTSSGDTFSYFNDVVGRSKMVGNYITYQVINGSDNAFPFYKGNEYQITVGLYGYCLAGTSGTTTLSLVDESGNKPEISLGTIVFGTYSTTKYYTVATTYKPTEDSTVWYPYSLKIVNDNAVPLSRVGQYGYKDAGISVISPNYLYYTGTTYTLNDLMSSNYTQANFINDICNQFNLYLFNDVHNIKQLNLLTYDDFYKNDVVDWSKKFSTDKLEIFDTSQQVYYKYLLNDRLGNDKIGKNYQELTGSIYGSNTVYNTNELAIKDINSVSIKHPQGILIDNLWGNFSNALLAVVPSPDKLPIMTYNTGKENSDILFGYLNNFHSWEYLYGGYSMPYSPEGYDTNIFSIGWSFFNGWVGTRSITSYLTMSPYHLTGNTYGNYKLQGLNNANVFDLQFNSKALFNNTYSASTITNNNLYNNFYADDLESKLYTNQKFLKAKMKLQPKDVLIENFRKRIWIDNAKLGGQYYRLNKIVYSSDDSQLADVELYSELGYKAIWSGLTDVTLYNYDSAKNQVGKVISRVPVPQPTGSTVSELYFATPDYPYALLGINNPNGRTFTINFTSVIIADCDVQFPGNNNSSTVNLDVTTDGGSTWTTLDTITASIIPPGVNANSGSTLNHSLIGITDVSLIKFQGAYDYSSGADGQNGYWHITLTSITANTGSASIICPDFATASGSDGTPTLSCTF